MAQPSMPTDHGVILTIGLITNNDRWAIVLPMATDSTHNSRINMANDCGHGFQSNALPALLACLSSDTSVVYISAEGMTDGMVPARVDYAVGVHPGTRDPGPLPTSVAALLAFYMSPDELAPGGRMRVGKNFIAGIAATDVIGDHVQNALITVLSTFAQLLMNGYLGFDGVSTWYRCVATKRDAGNVENVVTTQVRGYVATQRRRLIPH